MNPSRRHYLQTMVGALLLPAIGRARATGAEMLIRVNIPGPRALPFLPIELIPLLNFDHELGARLVVRHHASGIRAAEDMLAGNADFAALGFPALPLMHARGKDVVAISPLAGHEATFGFVLRRNLVKEVRGIGDLKGRPIAAASGSTNSKAYPQLLAESLLSANGVAADQVRWLPTAQNWEGISGVLISQAADAVFCGEPFISRLVRTGWGVMLANLADPQVSAQVAGMNHLRSAIATSRALAARQPEKVDLFVRMARRSLAWIQATATEQVAQRAPADTEEERQEIAALLKKWPGMFNPDGRFSAPQIAETDIFLRAAVPTLKLAPAASLIDDRWAGSRK